MVTRKTAEEIETLKHGGRLLAGVLAQVAGAVRPGVSAKALDTLAEKLIREAGGEPSFKGYNPYGAAIPYPAALCVSINDEVVHAIPTEDRILQDGDLVGLDIGMFWPQPATHLRQDFGGQASDKQQATRGVKSQELRVKGRLPMATDTAVTVGVGKISPMAEKLLRATRESLERGIAVVRAGAHVGDIGAAIQSHIEAHGFGVVRDLAGHGVGYKVHEDPFIPNYGEKGKGLVLQEGMVIAIEPMATEGTWRVTLDPNEWCYRTADGKLAAHFEHTVVVTKDGCEVVTKGS